MTIRLLAPVERTYEVNPRRAVSFVLRAPFQGCRRSGLLAERQRPADDEMGKGCIAEGRAPGISAPATDAQGVAESERALGLCHPAQRRKPTFYVRWKNPRAVPSRIRLVRGNEAGRRRESAVVSPHFSSAEELG